MFILHFESTVFLIQWWITAFTLQTRNPVIQSHFRDQKRRCWEDRDCRGFPVGEWAQPGLLSAAGGRPGHCRAELQTLRAPPTHFCIQPSQTLVSKTLCKGSVPQQASHSPKIKGLAGLTTFLPWKVEKKYNQLPNLPYALLYDWRSTSRFFFSPCDSRLASCNLDLTCRHSVLFASCLPWGSAFDIVLVPLSL